MDIKKTINISSELLSGLSNVKTRKRREKKQRPVAVVKPNTLKRALLKRIKEHATNERTKQSEPIKQNNQAAEQFSNDFDKHLDYLTNLTEINNKKRKKAIISQQRKSQEQQKPLTPDINIELPNELTINNSVDFKETTSFSNENKPEANTKPPRVIERSNELTINKSVDFKETTSFSNEKKPEANTKPPRAISPPYSNLKNGSKPTFKEWKRQTQKNMDSIKIDDHKLAEKTSRALRLEEIRTRLKENNIKQQHLQEGGKKNSITKRRTCKRKYKFGKDNVKNVVSVLIKNSTTRKNVQQEYNILKNTPISEVKDYLKGKTLLKAGSMAPNDVLRKTYEQLHLAGDITNKNTEVLIHNYMNA